MSLNVQPNSVSPTFYSSINDVRLTANSAALVEAFSGNPSQPGYVSRVHTRSREKWIAAIANRWDKIQSPPPPPNNVTTLRGLHPSWTPRCHSVRSSISYW